MSRLSTQAAAAMGAGRARARASKGPTAHQPAKTSATGTGDGLDIFSPLVVAKTTVRTPTVGTARHPRVRRCQAAAWV